MSTSPLDTFKFRLPEGKDLEVVLVRLADGRLVARTADELPAPERTETPATSPPSEKP